MSEKKDIFDDLFLSKQEEELLKLEKLFIIDTKDMLYEIDTEIINLKKRFVYLLNLKRLLLKEVKP